MMQNRLLGVETSVTNWQRRQNSSNTFSAVILYDLKQQRKMLDNLASHDQRMVFAVVTLVPSGGQQRGVGQLPHKSALFADDKHPQ